MNLVTKPAGFNTAPATCVGAVSRGL